MSDLFFVFSVIATFDTASGIYSCNCSHSLSKWYLVFASNVTELTHSIIGQHPEAVGKESQNNLFGECDHTTDLFDSFCQISLNAFFINYHKHFETCSCGISKNRSFYNTTITFDASRFSVNIENIVWLVWNNLLLMLESSAIFHLVYEFLAVFAPFRE